MAVAVISDCFVPGLWFEGLISGRQAAWRPGSCGLVSSCLVAALCMRCTCLKVTALHLGSGCGLILGRQAAWRPGFIGMVLSRLVAALCKQLPCLKVTAWFLGSGCGLELCRQVAWRPETLRRHDVLTAAASSRREASRSLNCCCEQQRCCDVATFKSLLRTAGTLQRVASGNSRDLGRGGLSQSFPGSVSPFLSIYGWVSQENNSRPLFNYNNLKVPI